MAGPGAGCAIMRAGSDVQVRCAAADIAWRWQEEEEGRQVRLSTRGRALTARTTQWGVKERLGRDTSTSVTSEPRFPSLLCAVSVRGTERGRVKFPAVVSVRRGTQGERCVCGAQKSSLQSAFINRVRSAGEASCSSMPSGEAPPSQRGSRIRDWKAYAAAAYSKARTLVHAVSMRASANTNADESELESASSFTSGRGTGAWYLTLERHFLEKVLGTRQNFANEDTIATAVTDADYLHVLRTSYPIQAALSKAWFRQMSLVLCIVYIITGSLAMRGVGETGGLEAKWVRFVSRQQRGDVDGQSSASVL
eukprot:618041-Rhodomonas_salina.2